MSSQRRSGRDWIDPYALDDDVGTGTEDDTEEHNAYYAGDAPVRPMGSLYAASGVGAHSVRGPPPQHALGGGAHQHQEPLMYAPRYNAHATTPYAGAAARHPDSRVLSTTSSARVSQVAQDHHAPHPAGRYYDEAGIGVGVPEEEHEDEYLETQERPYSSSSDLHATRASSQRPMAAAATPPQRPLPKLKESKPPMFQYKPVEPATPTPRRSRRYLNTSKRVLDIEEGRDALHSVHPDYHVVNCETCLLQWQVPKTAVLMKCPTCRHVSSVPSVQLKHAAFMR